MHDDVDPCVPGGCEFSRSWETNEPIGRCWRCAITVEEAEARWEAHDEMLAVAPQVPTADLADEPGYWAALAADEPPLSPEEFAFPLLSGDV